MKKISEMTDEELKRRSLELDEKVHRREELQAKLKLIELIAIAVVLVLTVIGCNLMSR